jgi:hypothetical protein
MIEWLWEKSIEGRGFQPRRCSNCRLSGTAEAVPFQNRRWKMFSRRLNAGSA